jgi:hypothetical protein
VTAGTRCVDVRVPRNVSVPDHMTTCLTSGSDSCGALAVEHRVWPPVTDL